MKSCKMQMLPRWKSSNYLRDATVIGRENVLGFKWSLCWMERGFGIRGTKFWDIFGIQSFFWHHHWWSTSAALVDGDWSTTLDQKLLKISWRLSISSSDLIKESIFPGGALYQHIHLLFPPWAFSGLPSLRDRQSGRCIHLVIFFIVFKKFWLENCQGYIL